MSDRSPPVVVHLPHASTQIPPNVRPRIRLREEELDSELLRMTDLHTDDLFAMPASIATTVAFPVSRLVVDPERFEDDEQEPMAERGMGVIYTRTSGLQTLREDLTPGEREALLARYYRPHHEKFTAAAAGAIEALGAALARFRRRKPTTASPPSAHSSGANSSGPGERITSMSLDISTGRRSITIGCVAARISIGRASTR
jgi:N-formylglutamate amidohydrolase